MRQTTAVQERRTSANVVFDYLRDEITSLRLRPGDKISEAEIAAKFKISRQPVRDAFSRLSNLDLLVVRPQKATLVKKFSRSGLNRERFVRLAVELEVAHLAVQNWRPEDGVVLRDALDRQRAAVAAQDIDAFHRLDYAFHAQICRVAGAEFAFDVIVEKKEQVDRLCVLSLTGADAMQDIVADHVQIVDALEAQDEVALVNAVRKHLSRLDATIEDIERTHETFFDD
ncbi:MAG: GntR family transcriptional regulator [Pseudomonadota bacterium]